MPQTTSQLPFSFKRRRQGLFFSDLTLIWRSIKTLSVCIMAVSVDTTTVWCSLPSTPLLFLRAAILTWCLWSVSLVQDKSLCQNCQWMQPLETSCNQHFLSFGFLYICLFGSCFRWRNQTYRQKGMEQGDLFSAFVKRVLRVKSAWM